MEYVIVADTLKLLAVSKVLHPVLFSSHISTFFPISLKKCPFHHFFTQVMGGLERQVADYHEREEEVQRLATESKQKVEDALSLKDQASAREDHSYREVNRLMDERGVMLLKRQVRVSHSILQSKDGRVIYKLIRDP